MNKKKIFLILLIIIIIVLGTIFLLRNDNKKIISGNNIVKSKEQLEKYILNIESYEAEVEVTVNSNKNTNKYLIKQQYYKPDVFKQEVIEPDNISGVKITLNGNSLSIENSKLTLSQVFENYQYIGENFLCLDNFIENYKENSNYIEKENEIILETKSKSSENKYAIYQKLYIDKNTGLPTKLEVQDDNQKPTVYILYKEIKINSTKKEEIIAFELFYDKLINL